ncbi:MAG: DPP IV N-terminal domain-containing protein [Chitinophagaceae bacterium]|nr:DPP IV N-terminal domain-containing protein [Chitinophagaceae bacterium]
MKFRGFKIIILFVCLTQFGLAQNRGSINWTEDGNAFTKIKDGGIIKVDPRTEAEIVLVRKEQLTPAGATKALTPQSYAFNNNNTRLLIFTNTAKVWRYNTRGDYWVLDIIANKLKQLGKTLPAQSLMFAKFSPDGRKVAYVSEHNIYVEEISSGNINKLTKDGTRKLINGTFDWVYEEEFGCRDGFRWSPDGSRIAFWQVDATRIRDYYMLNTTDSVYSQVIPVEYPKVGEAPSPVKIGVVSLDNGYIRWMDIEGDPQQNYLPRMEWAGLNELVVQQLDRKQQESKLKYCNVTDGSSRTFWAENSDAWVDLNSADIFGEPGGWSWINKGMDFIWVSEKDGWRHIYKISRDGKTETLLTKGNYDIGDIKCIDEANNYIYFTASPINATQLYLYRVNIEKGNILQKVKKIVSKPKSDPELVSTDSTLKGTHNYSISPNGKFATHSFSSHNTPPVREWITLPDNKPINPAKSIAVLKKTDNNANIEYLQVITEDNITLDAWINKPTNFDPSKKYPVVLYVYGEPAASTVLDRYGEQNNFLYNGDMRRDGYVQVAIDNRGTPMLKGAAWRKSIYRKIGDINIRDMAMGFKKLMEQNNYFDKDRIAVWGWSGGGSSTLNLLFRYPEIFQTGISIAAVANQLFYDNIYQERYMGLPQENRDDFINGSPVTYAKNLKGNLLYIHGTGDDNVHFSNAEVLVNELIKNGKQFQYMPYPNRTHSISEGAGTFQHLSTLYTTYLRAHCPPGAR